MPSFDCFLSHNSKDKSAVRALKLALEEQDVRCWLDEEQLRPGLPWQSLLEQGIKGAASVAVCVAADGIGPWEDEEMRAALTLAVRDGRPVIPVVLPGAPVQPELPLFLTNRTWVDLRGGLGGAGLARLVWGITGRPPTPGASAASAAGPVGGPAVGPPPLPSDSVFLDEVFELLYSKLTLILLAQADRELNGSLVALRERAKERFGPAQVLHLTPPQGPDATESEFFATLGRRAGMQPVPQDVGAFASRLEDRLAAGERLFFLISGLHSCSDAGRAQLAHRLRGLSDHYHDAVPMVLVGGEGLAALKSADGLSSLLSHAEPMHWPEWNTGDLMDQARRSIPPLDLSAEDALALLTASGGHPRLILDALRLRAKGRPLPECTQALERSSQIEAQFSAIAQDPDQRRDLKDWLARTDLGAFRTCWIGDPLLRRLYWLNLLRADGPAGQERLVWRCPAVVRAGLRVLS
jgi:hypothetical protein